MEALAVPSNIDKLVILMEGEIKPVGNVGFSERLRNALAYYPLTFYFGLLLLVLAGLFLGFQLSFSDLYKWLINHQTSLLFWATALLGLILVSSALTYRKVCKLSRADYILWLEQRSTRTLFPIFTPLHDWLRLRVAVYRWWNTQVISSTVHYIFLLLFGLFVIVQIQGVATKDATPTVVSPLEDTCEVFQFTVQPDLEGAVTAGTAFSATVTAYMLDNEPCSDYYGSIHFTSTDPQAVLPADYTFSIPEGGTHTFTNAITLKTSGTQSITVTEVGSSANGVASGIVVNPGSATSLAVTGVTTPITAGTASSVTVRAKDNYSNTVPSYTGTIHFSSGDAQAVLPSNYTFVGGDAGTHTFTNGVTLKTAGSQSVTATDISTAITGSQASITVNPSTIANLVFSSVPTTAVAGTAFSPSVRARDAYGNTATGYTGTVRFTSSDTQAVLPSNYAFVGDDAGVHTFSAAVTLKTAGSKNIVVTDTVTSSYTVTQAITVSPGAVSSLTLSSTPTTTIAGMAFSTTVTLKDTYANTATNYTGSVRFSSNDAQAALPSNYTFVGGDAGVHTFSSAITLKTSGSKTFTITETQNAAINATGTLTVSPASAEKISTTSPLLTRSTVAGVSFSNTIQFLDAYNNVATGYTGKVTFSSSDSKAVLPSDYTYTAEDAGTKAFSGFVLKTAGSQTISLAVAGGVTYELDGPILEGVEDELGSATAPTLVAGVQNKKLAQVLPVFGGEYQVFTIQQPFNASFDVSVSAAEAKSLSLSADQSSTTAGKPVSLTVVAKDEFGNTATNYGGKVSFVSSDKQATLPTSFSFGSSEAGNRSFSNGATFTTAGSQTVTATDQLDKKLTSTATLQVTAGALSAYSISTTTPQLVGRGWKETVRSIDAYGNHVIDSNQTLVPTAQQLEATFFTSDSYETLANVYELTNGLAELYLKTSDPGTIIIGVADDNGHKGFSGTITVSTGITEAPPAVQEPAKEGKISFFNDSPGIERSANITAAATTSIALASAAPAGSFLATIVTTNAVQGVSLFNLSFLGIGRRRKKKRWGLVRSALTGLPLAGVLVELYNNNGTRVGKVMTDRSGQFAFLVDAAGQYRIRINNPLYRPFMSQPIIISDAKADLVEAEIILIPIEEAIERRMRRVAWLLRSLELLNYLSWPLLIAGSVLSIIVLYHNPTVFRYVLVALYGLLWVSKLIEGRKRHTYGRVLDKLNNKPLKLAVVQLTTASVDGPQMVRSTITDKQGRFLFVVQPNKYHLVVAKEGYLPKEVEVKGANIDLNVELDPESIVK